MPDPPQFHETMSDGELERQYNLRAGRPDYDVTVIPAWIAQSEQARASTPGRLDIRYGAGEKQKLDLFSCGRPDAPVLVYFHGGYWQRGDKSIYSFLAQPFTQQGVNVAIVGYDLCPNVTITQISEEAREAVAYLWQQADELDIDRDRLTIMGHSAGGHITEMLMATDWATYAKDMPQDLIRSGIPISPLSLLEPVRRTSLNDGIRMSPEEAAAESPMLNHPPITNAPQCLVVGGKETSEFHRQSQMYRDAFQSAQRSIDLYIVPDVDHFDELNVLADPTSEFFAKVRDMLA